MNKVLKQSYCHLAALMMSVTLVSAPGFSQDAALPVPAITDQLAAQGVPLTNETPETSPLQPTPGMQTTKPQTTTATTTAAPSAPSQNELNTQTAETQTTGTQEPVSGTSALDEIRARAQAEQQGTAMPQAAQQAASPTPSGDALPQVQTIRLKTEGMDYVGESAVNIEMRDTPLDTSNEEYQQGIRQEALDSAANGLFPLQPNEIKQLLGRYDETRRAVETPHYDLPAPEVSVETISLDPGVTPATIKTAVGHVTTLTMLDITGAPWPIQDVSWAGDFEVVEPEEGGHIIRITPMANFAYGNLSMRLLTLKTPITMTLRTTRDVVQYRFDARIPEYGPMAEAPLIDGGKEINAGSTILTQVLDGLTPSNAERLDVSGVDGRTTAIQIGETTYLRTPLTLLSPAWDSSVKSADGMHVYAMAQTPVVLLSDEGNFRRATLRVQEEGLFDERSE